MWLPDFWMGVTTRMRQPGSRSIQFQEDWRSGAGAGTTFLHAPNDASQSRQAAEAATRRLERDNKHASVLIGKWRS